jgi:DNA-directed RNA polymerase specialized sigma24 family protein
MSVDNFDALAQHVIKLARRNADRYPTDAIPDPLTGVPITYIDTLVETTIQERTAFEKLLQKDIEAWEDMLSLIHGRVSGILRLRYSDNNILTPLHDLIDDLTLHCTEILWKKLGHYPFDCSLIAWIRLFVAREVSSLQKSADFKHNVRARSLDRPISTPLGERRLGDFISDDTMADQFDRSDDLLSILPSLRLLSDAQRNVIRRQLAGQTTEEIATHMNRNRNAIYQLRHSAIKNLRRLMKVDM